MRAGDLVTLSAKTLQRNALWKWSLQHRRHQLKTEKQLVGLVIRVGKSTNHWEHGKMLYEIRWMEPDGPTGRDGNGRYTFAKYFWRTDLKFVSRG